MTMTPERVAKLIALANWTAYPSAENRDRLDEANATLSNQILDKSIQQAKQGHLSIQAAIALTEINNCADQLKK